ncbi:hypothetical protein Droror1_Dr00023919 [Drosera rotundifolia]
MKTSDAKLTWHEMRGRTGRGHEVCRRLRWKRNSHVAVHVEDPNHSQPQTGPLVSGQPIPLLDPNSCLLIFPHRSSLIESKSETLTELTRSTSVLSLILAVGDQLCPPRCFSGRVLSSFFFFSGGLEVVKICFVLKRELSKEKYGSLVEGYFSKKLSLYYCIDSEVMV